MYPDLSVLGGVGGEEIDEVSVRVVDEVGGEVGLGDDEEDMTADLMLALVGCRRQVSIFSAG